MKYIPSVISNYQFQNHGVNPLADLGLLLIYSFVGLMVVNYFMSYELYQRSKFYS